jgi:Protein O-mannosyl-transferase TMEM260-like
VSDEGAARPTPTGAPSSLTVARSGSLSRRDAVTAALLFLGLGAIFALTRSRWLDDWDSVNFALGLDAFDVTKHQPHPPGYPIYIAAGKLVHFVIADHAAALTLVSSLAGAAVAAMFYILARRQLAWFLALCATIIMALTPLFWLQAGLALSDMFGMVFVLAFLLVEGASPQTPRGDRLRRIVSGFIAGLSLGARPHFTLLIVAYWCVRGLSSSSTKLTHFLTAAVAFSAGVAAWLIPASAATGGLETYLAACLAQFEWRLDKPAASLLGGPISSTYLLSRAGDLIGWLGQAFAPVHLTASHLLRRTALALTVVIPYVFFAWRSPSKAVARPYIVASAVYLLMLFIMLPTQHLRYFLPFCLIVGWSVAGFVELFERPLVRAAALTTLFAVNVVPSFFLVKGLSQVPPPIAALNWIRSSRPAAVLYSGELLRHATYYWREGAVRREPRTEAECANFRQDIAASTVLSTLPDLCGFQGRKIVSFKRDARVHDKHHLMSIFEFGPLTP